MSALIDSNQQRLDALEREMLEKLPAVPLPVEHLFTPGLYRRTITMPPGSVVTSKIHRTEHPYAVLRGRVLVWMPHSQLEMLEAGHQGVTKPGTRRALYIPDDSEPCVWETYHPLSSHEEHLRMCGATDEELVAAIEERIIEPHLHEDGTDAHLAYLEILKAAKGLTFEGEAA